MATYSGNPEIVRMNFEEGVWKELSDAQSQLEGTLDYQGFVSTIKTGLAKNSKLPNFKWRRKNKTDFLNQIFGSYTKYLVDENYSTSEIKKELKVLADDIYSLKVGPITISKINPLKHLKNYCSNNWCSDAVTKTYQELVS